VLEIAAGSGTHTAWFARRFPDRAWWPTDIEPASLASIEGWRATLEAEGGPMARVGPAEQLDVTSPRWPIEDRPADVADLGAVFCANMIHIAPWAATRGLLAGAARVLGPGGRVFLYGPFRFDGVHTAPSNARFDRYLRGQDPRWGVRDLADVTALADTFGLHRQAVIEMPANNHIIEFAR